ncbi:MAG: RsmE family RNA methyltransferase [Elusimicrobiota bacterium]
MPQFLVAPEDVSRTSFRLKGPEAFHVAKVMRLGIGASLELFDGKGGRFRGVISSIQPDGSVLGEVTETIALDDVRAPARIHLNLGLLKSSHWDYALEKATELGVASFTPILTPRTVVLLHEIERAKSKAERWSRLIMAAAKQCGRADLPPVHPAVQFRDAIRALKDEGLVFLAWEKMKGPCSSQTLGAALRGDRSRGAGQAFDVHVFIGPEGGYTEDEVELARTEGAVVFGMGPRILRAETAAVAAVALIQYELGAL